MTRLPLPAFLVLPVPPAAHESKRRSLTCVECSRPVGAGRVRHPACLAHAIRRKEGTQH